MSVTASRTIGVTYSGDISGQENFAAADNTLSPGKIDLVTLALGSNTITVPAVSGFTTKGLTIIPPSANSVLITAKGVTGDTGIALHKTDPSSLGIDTTQTTLVLTAASTIAGVRLVWS